jgi:hypothetical protein
MNDFIKINLQDRKPYFEIAATNSGLPVNIIEKDFWVCWILERIFSLPSIGSNMIFKGGTTLSKVYSVIDRFSEDVDLSIDKEKLGFIGEKDPEQAINSKKQKQLIEDLAASCKIFIKNELHIILYDVIVGLLGKDNNWELVIDQHESDGQTILFNYPAINHLYGSYINPSVKIELGARSDNWPAQQHLLTPYLHQYLPINAVKKYSVNVRVLDVARTFWEKATILHMYANWPEQKIINQRQSRHYYDFFKLLKSTYLPDALSKLNLLTRVAMHKQIYFRCAWAKYEQAKIGTLKLMPPSHVESSMRKDYLAMREMFFNTPPGWDEIITAITQFEVEFNSAMSFA